MTLADSRYQFRVCWLDYEGKPGSVGAASEVDARIIVRTRSSWRHLAQVWVERRSVVTYPWKRQA